MQRQNHTFERENTQKIHQEHIQSEEVGKRKAKLRHIRRAEERAERQNEDRVSRQRKNANKTTER